VNVDTAILDRTARASYALSRDLDRMRQAATRAGGANIAQEMQDLQGRAWTTMRALVDAGAADPTSTVTPGDFGGQVTTAAPSVPLALLDTPANRRLLHALLEAHEAARAVDEERGIVDGFADVVEHFTAGVQTEIYGPADLRQSSGREGR